MSLYQAITIKASPAEIWPYLADASLLQLWLMPTVGFAPMPGTAFVFKSECEGRQTRIECRVVTVVVNQELAFTWQDLDLALDSVVSIKLTACAQGTLVELKQNGWSTQPAAAERQHADTWAECLTELQTSVLLSTESVAGVGYPE